MEPIVGSRAAMFNTRVYAAVRDHTEIKETERQRMHSSVYLKQLYSDNDVEHFP